MCANANECIYRETCLHLFARSATDSLQLRTNWSEMHSKWHGTDPYSSGTGCRHIVCHSRAGVLAENKRAESTKVSHLFPPRPPDSGAWLFASGTPTNACFFSQVPSKKKSNPKCALELPMGEWPWSTARALSLSLSLLPSLFLSFTHLVFLSQSPHSADVRRWQWEGLKGGMSCASVSPPADGTSAKISVYVDVKLGALCSIPLSSLKKYPWRLLSGLIHDYMSKMAQKLFKPQPFKCQKCTVPIIYLLGKSKQYSKIIIVNKSLNVLHLFLI